jgi:hypothetical protein
MKKIILMIVLLMLVILVLSAKVVPLPGLLKPYQVRVDESKIYIVEGAAICIYSLKDFSFLKKFGKEGEGPQEFIIPPPGGVEIVVQPDFLLVSSPGKISYLTKEGEFKKEIKVTAIMHSGFFPIGKSFVGFGMKQEDNIIYYTINIFDTDLKKGNEVFRFKSPLQPGKVDFITASRRPLLSTFENKIFHGGEEGEIYVFDASGKKISTISHKYEKVKLSDKHKKRYIDFFKTDPRFKQGWERFRDGVQFPGYFPVIRDLTVSDGKIYVLTYKEKEKKREFYLSGIDGKQLKKIMLPLPEMNPLELYPYTIRNNTLYQIIDNDDSEEWELHITKIEL